MPSTTTRATSLAHAAWFPEPVEGTSGVVATERILRGLSTPSAAALRGVAVVQTALLTSSDLTRSLLGFLPGFLDIPLVLWAVGRIDRRFATNRPAVKDRTSTPHYADTFKEPVI